MEFPTVLGGRTGSKRRRNVFHGDLRAEQSEDRRLIPTSRVARNHTQRWNTLPCISVILPWEEELYKITALFETGDADDEDGSRYAHEPGTKTRIVRDRCEEVRRRRIYQQDGTDASSARTSHHRRPHTGGCRKKQKRRHDGTRRGTCGWMEGAASQSKYDDQTKKKKRMGRGSNILARLFPRLRYRYQPPCLRPVPVSAGPWCGCNNRCELENNSTRRRKIRKRRRNVREWADSSPSLSSDSDTNLQENGRRPILNTVFIKFIKNHTTKQVLIQRYQSQSLLPVQYTQCQIVHCYASNNYH